MEQSKLIPEDNIKFAFLRKAFFPQAVLVTGLFNYLKTVNFDNPFFIVSASAERILIEKLGSVLARTDKNTEILTGEPTKEIIEVLTRRIRDGKYDTLVAVGGGSVLDTAKIVKEKNNIHLVAVPTTPSTGSETTPYALYTEAREKKLLRGKNLLPDVVVLDPSFLESIPKRQMGYFIFDILGHAFEGLVSKMATPMSDAFARESIALTLRSFKYLVQPYPEKVLANVQVAGFFGGVVQSMASVGMAHSFAHYFGARFNIPHAKALSIFLPITIAINARSTDAYEKLNDIGIADTKELLNILREIAEFFGISGEHISVDSSFDTDAAMKVIQKEFCTPTNPIRFTTDDFEEVFQKTLLQL